MSAICAPRATLWAIKWMACPTCVRRSPFVTRFFEWYGWYVTCLRCGEEWQDGEMLPRPFAPRWRKQNIERAKKAYRARPLEETPQQEGEQK